jgi:predicted nicotinamide N-methyase
MAVDDPEQNLPYWAEIWPSGIALAASVVRDAAALAEKRTLELGCGLGITAIAALRAGADLLATDYAAEALALCAFNCERALGRVPQLMRVNWRDPHDRLFVVAGNGFPLVLAADVLYEARDVEPLLALVERVVAPGGELWLAEPGRAPAARFLDAMAALGWQANAESWSGPWPDPEDNRKGVVVTVHKMTKPGSCGERP